MAFGKQTAFLFLALALGPWAQAHPAPVKNAARAKVAPVANVRPAPVSRPQTTTGLLVVKLKNPNTPATRARIAKALGGKIIRVIPALHTMLVEPIPGALLASGATKDPAIEYIESETLLEAQGYPVREAKPGPFEREGLPSLPQLARATADLLSLRELFRPDGEDGAATAEGVNDPYFRYQWGLHQYPYGVGLPSARARAQGQGITVAVIDTGVRQDLADLQGTRFVPGRNFIAGGANATDDNGHGSHVAGTIAQATNNGIGCSGIAPQAAIMPVKVLGKDGRGTNFNIANGILWAADHGAHVINLSLGGASSRTLQDAVRYAHRKGVTIVAAAGNAGTQGLIFPAGYAEVISVGAIDKTGKRADFSQWGSGLAIAAPGVTILQQTISRSTGAAGYYYFSGTSMACPHVAGSAALVRQAQPTLTPGQLRQRLQQTAHDLGAPGADSYYGAGAVDAAAAVGTSGPAPDVPLPEPPREDRPVPEPAPEPAPTVEASALLTLINQERSQTGSAAVALQGQLTAAALAHARDMAEMGRLSHTGSDGSSSGTRISRQGYAWRTYGETIAAGQQTVAAVHQAWMHSPPHKAIILDGRYTEVGLATYQKEGATTRYWCQVFAAR